MKHIDVKLFTTRVVKLVIAFHYGHASVLVCSQHSNHLSQRCIKLSLHSRQPLTLYLTDCFEGLNFGLHLLPVVSHLLFQNFFLYPLFHSSERLTISLTFFLSVPELVISSESSARLRPSERQRKKFLLAVIYWQVCLEEVVEFLKKAYALIGVCLQVQAKLCTNFLEFPFSAQNCLMPQQFFLLVVNLLLLGHLLLKFAIGICHLLNFHLVGLAYLLFELFELALLELNVGHRLVRVLLLLLFSAENGFVNFIFCLHCIGVVFS